MTDGTLFISDSSISNPIVRAQGIPFLGFQAEMGKTCVFFSFENKDDENFYEKIVADIKAEVSRKIIFEKMVIKPGKFLPPWFSFIYDGLKSTLSVIHKYNIRILHTRSFFPSLLGLIIKQLFNRNISLLYDNRGLLIEEEILKGHWNSSGLKVMLFRQVEKYILKKADKVVVVSDWFKEYLIDRYKNKVPDLARRIVTIPNRAYIQPVSSTNFFSKRNSGKTVITYSGSSALWQSLKEMKQLFYACIEIFKNAEFRIITYNKEDFLQVFDDDEVRSNIIFIEAKPSEVFSHLSGCDFGIILRENNIINNAASPLKFGEYLAAGLPVLISDGVGDFSKMVSEHKVGVVVKNSDYEKALQMMKELIEENDIHRRCREFAEREFDIKMSFKQYEDVYNSLISDDR